MNDGNYHTSVAKSPYTVGHMPRHIPRNAWSVTVAAVNPRKEARHEDCAAGIMRE
ncbi:MAG: hypothetical protein V1792_16200 [Pseudomonadota bacterium]